MYPVKDKDKCRISLPYGYKYPLGEPYKSWGVAGKSHNGVDIARKDPKLTYYILAPISGKVCNAYSGYYKELPPEGTDARTKFVQAHKEGNYVSIDSSDSDGLHHILLHMWKVMVRPGQIVKKGQVIGVMGTSGMSTGIHLHYAVKDEDGWVDPKPFLT
jgi:murein DD-endopeptidase MepM/ murein hydrolase activator NlpD